MPIANRAPQSAILADAITPEALRPWPFPALTPQQQIERQCMEAAIAADALRSLPTCFGDLP